MYIQVGQVFMLFILNIKVEIGQSVQVSPSVSLM